MENNNTNELQIKSELVLSNPVQQLDQTIDKSKSFVERAQDVATFLATKGALEDGELLDKITDIKKDELTETAKANFKKGQAQSRVAEKELQQSLFGIYEGLASYIGLKRDLPQSMLKVLMFFIQPILGLILLSTGLIVGVINVLLDGINSVAEKFKDLADTTKHVVKSLFLIAIVFVVLLVINHFLLKFGIDIF